MIQRCGTFPKFSPFSQWPKTAGLPVVNRARLARRWPNPAGAPRMIDHLGIPVGEYARSQAFHRAGLALGARGHGDA